MPDKPARADARRNRARILDAATEIFNNRGSDASTQDVAREAGVGIGTVFRHFPTKDDLLRAIVERGVGELSERIAALVDDGDPATAFFDFFAHMVARASSMRTVVRLLGESGADLRAEKPLAQWRSTIDQLLARAKDAGAVRPEIGVEETLALLLSTCQAAVTAGWDAELQTRTLAIIFAGMRPPRP